MKKEILRINDLTYSYTQTRKLEHVSLCILEGECVGIQGLSYSGKELLIQLLEGEIEANLESYSIYIEGKKIEDRKSMNDKIYRIGASNYKIGDWTVAEYIGLVDSGWLDFFRDRRRLEEEIEDCFKELEVDFDVSEKIGNLSELDKRIVDFVKAYRKQAKIVIVEDELDGISKEEILRFRHLMKRIIAGRMAVLVCSYSNIVLSVLADKYIIFNKGRIVKKCRKEYIQNEEQLEKFLLGGAKWRNEKDKMKRKDYYSGKDIIYRVRNVKMAKGEYMDFDFFRGQITAILARSLREKERIFETVSGRKCGFTTHYILNSRRYDHAEFSKFVEERVVSVKNLGSGDEVFMHMSVGENLLLPSLQKMSSGEHIWLAERMKHVVAAELDIREEEQKRQIESIGVNEIICVTLERWYIYNPRVLVLFEPFAQCDINGTAIVRSYIQKFARRGAAVIIVNTREENIEDLVDRFIVIDSR